MLWVMAPALSSMRMSGVNPSASRSSVRKASTSSTVALPLGNPFTIMRPVTCRTRVIARTAALGSAAISALVFPIRARSTLAAHRRGDTSFVTTATLYLCIRSDRAIPTRNEVLPIDGPPRNTKSSPGSVPPSSFSSSVLYPVGIFSAFWFENTRGTRSSK